MIDIRRPCTYGQAAIVVCNESDILKLAECHFKSDLEYNADLLPANFQSILVGLWRTIFHRRDTDPVVFRAQSGTSIIGIGCATKNTSVEHGLCQYDAQFHILRVLKEAQRNEVGRRLLSCLSANLYANGARSSYMLVDAQDHETISFVKALGGTSHSLNLEHKMMLFVWHDLIPLINDAYRN